MKLYEVKREYGLNQNTFYGWLRENQAIEKTDNGYIAGPNAFEGMETLVTTRTDGNGELFEQTQVTVENQKIPSLIKQYEQSGLPKLYSPKKISDSIMSEEVVKLKTELTQAISRIDVLGNQLLILTKQLSSVLDK